MFEHGRPTFGRLTNDLKGAAMSHTSSVRADLLLALVAAVGIFVAQATASWNTGSQVGASWVSEPREAPE